MSPASRMFAEVQNSKRKAIKNLGSFFDETEKRVKLMDFGAVKSTESSGEQSSSDSGGGGENTTDDEEEDGVAKNSPRPGHAVVGVWVDGADPMKDKRRVPIEPYPELMEDARFLRGLVGKLRNSANPVRIPAGFTGGGSPDNSRDDTDAVQPGDFLCVLHDVLPAKLVKQLEGKFVRRYFQYLAVVGGTAPYKLKKLSAPFTLPATDAKVPGLGGRRSPEALQTVYSAWIEEGSQTKLWFSYGVNDCQAAVVSVGLEEALEFLDVG